MTAKKEDNIIENNLNMLTQANQFKNFKESILLSNMGEKVPRKLPNTIMRCQRVQSERW